MIADPSDGDILVVAATTGTFYSGR